MLSVEEEKCINKLKGDLNFSYYERNYQDDGNDLDTCASFANVNKELAEKIGNQYKERGKEINKKYYEEAIKLYNQAIEYEKKVHYYKEIIDIYKLMDTPELSVPYIIGLHEVPKHDSVDKFVADYVMKNVLDLASIQQTLKELKNAGKISIELADALIHQAGIVSGLVLKVGGHDGRIKNLEEMIPKLLQQLSDLFQKDAAKDEIINTLKELYCSTDNTVQGLVKSYGIHESLLSPGTTVNMLTDIYYDNALLNHLNLLVKVTQIFGLNKALDIGSKLGQEFINKAAITEDLDSILAGAISLGYVDYNLI